MPTVQVAIVERAVRMLAQTPAGQVPSTAELTAALTALNAMLDSWRLDRLMAYAMRDESLTLSGGDPSYTIGTGGDLNTERPLKLEGAYVVVGTQSYPVDVITQDQYAALSNKSLQGPYPTRVYYEAAHPLGVAYPWPVPIDGSATLHILTRRPLAAVALADNLSVPPGWEDALASNLAVRLAPEYETSPSDVVVELARASKAAIKSANSTPIIAANELNGLVPQGHWYNVYADTQ